MMDPSKPRRSPLGASGQDPQRWSEPGGPAPDELRALLASAHPTRSMTAAEQARSATRIARWSAATPGGGPPAPRLISKPWLGVVGGVGVAAVVVALSPWQARRSPLSLPPPSSPPPVVAVVAPAAEETAPQRPGPTAAAPPVARPAAGAPRRTPVHAAVRDQEDPLTREQRVLERARSLLDRDPGAALAQLALYARQFPAGQLTAEKELLRVTALQRLGRHDEARAAGDALLARFPQGIYGQRVKAILGEAPR
jgi:hypothetical protein